MVKNFWRADTGIFLSLWVLLMLAGHSRLFGDPGTFLHLGVGQHILSSGQLIYTDPFSFTFSGKPWFDYGWLFDYPMALVNQMGGLDSVLLVTVTVLSCLYTWISLRFARAGIHWLVSILFTVLAMAGSSYHFHPRPHLATFVFLTWTFSRLCDYEAGRISLNRLFWLVPLFVLWTNMHGGMVGGVATMGLIVMGWSMAKLAGKDTPILNYRQMVPLIGLVILCGLTAFVNPYGLELPRVWFSLLGSPVLPRLISEHAPLYSQSLDTVSWTVLFLGFVYLVALVGTLPQWPRITWLIPLVWLWLTVMRIRNGPLFAITAVIALGDMFPHIRWVSWLTRHGSELLRIQPSKRITGKKRLNCRPALIPATLLIITAFFQIAAIPVPVIGHGWVKVDPKRYPVELLPELRKYEHEHPKGTPIFNEMSFGGFLIYYTPGLRVFIDDRCELYGDDGLLAYAHAIEEDPSQVDQWAYKFGFDIALTIPNSGFDRYLKNAGGWTIIRQTAAATFYRKNIR
jgi:hypothetical protein